MSMGGGGYNNPKFYFLIGIVFNLCLLGFFKYSDFFLENFNAFSQLLKLDFNIPLPHILLPLALSFVTFQQIAFLYDCYKSGRSGEKMSLDFIDYALFISFFPQLIAGPIVHHREMIPQFKKLATNSACSDFLGSASASSLQRTESASHSSASHNPKNSSTILEFAEGNSSLGETFRPFENFECSLESSLASRPKFSKEAKASTASRRLDERSEVPNTRIFSNANDGESQGDFADSMKVDCHDSAFAESRNDTSLSSLRGQRPKQSTLQNLESNDFMDSSNFKNKIDSYEANSRNDKMRADSSHSAESAKDSINSSHFVKSINENNPHNAPHLSTTHRFIKAYLNFTQTKLYLCLCFLLTFNFINIAWVFFRAENLGIALNVLKAMFGFGAPLPEKWYSVSQSLSQIDGGKSSVAYIILAFVLCLAFKNSFELMQRRLNLLTISLAGILLMFLSIKMFATDSLSPFLYFNF